MILFKITLQVLLIFFAMMSLVNDWYDEFYLFIFGCILFGFSLACIWVYL
jgi:hypothetical protein